MRGFFGQGGPRFFVSIKTTSTREVHSYTHKRCELVQNWDDVLKIIAGFSEPLRNIPNRVEIFTTPRLCPECLKHATQPLVFENTRSKEECLCCIEKDSRCDVHVKRGVKNG